MTDHSSAVDLLFVQAVDHREFGRGEDAEACLDELLSLDPAHIPALNEKGLLQMARGDLDRAAENFERIRDLDPDDPYAANRLSMIYRERGEIVQATELLRKALQANPYNSHLLGQQALVFHQASRPAESVECLERARQYRNLGNQIAHQAELLAKHMAPGVVIAGLAHEIRNVLESSNLSLRLLERYLRATFEEKDSDDLGLRDRAFDRIAQIKENSQRIAHLIRHFREIVTGGRAKKEVLHVPELVKFAFDLLGAKLYSVGIRWQPPDSGDLPPIRGHRVELEQVFINLLSNAHDALVESATAEPRIEVDITSNAQQDAVIVRVSDNGPGIPPNVVPQLFDHGFTTKTTGTGVGLWLCRFAVERADGEIELERSGSDGTTFRIQFPARGDDHAEA